MRVRLRNQIGSSALAEIAPALMIMFGVLVFLFVDLITICTACATCNLIALESCAQASKAPNIAAAISAMTKTASTLSQSPLAELSRLQPVKAAGTELFIVCTPINNPNGTTVTGPNTALAAVDTTSNVYECRTTAEFKVKPFFDLSRYPFIGDIPGLGKSFEFTCSSDRVLEHPENFSAEAQSVTAANIAAAPNQTRSLGAISVQDEQIADWNYHNPGMFALMPGQTVLQNSPGQVFATVGEWTPMTDGNGNPIILGAGQRLTITAPDSWKDQFGHTVTAWGDIKNYWNKLPVGSLVARVGSSSSSPTFEVGEQFWNEETGATGQLYLMFNDYYFRANSGLQNVKVTVTN